MQPASIQFNGTIPNRGLRQLELIACDSLQKGLQNELQKDRFDCSASSGSHSLELIEKERDETSSVLSADSARTGNEQDCAIRTLVQMAEDCASRQRFQQRRLSSTL